MVEGGVLRVGRRGQPHLLHAELTQLATAAGAAGTADTSNLKGIAGLAGIARTAGLDASSSFQIEQSPTDNAAQPAGAAGTAAFQNAEDVGKPDWRDDSDVLRGRLLELGGVSGLQTDTDCLLLKDLCRPGLEDLAFLEMVDLELQVRLQLR